MKLKFTKMQGAGNDFIMLDGIRQKLTLTPALARRLADRHFGIGADQLLIVEPPTLTEVDFKYRIFNADGGEVEHCGNGARCFLQFARDQGLTDKRSVRVQVQKGMITLIMQPNGETLVNMGAPAFGPACVAFNMEGLHSRAEGEDVIWPLQVDGTLVELSLVSMGNPHAVLRVTDADAAPVTTQGAQIGSHPRFLERVNVSFMQIVDRHTIRLRVYERGAAETLACGTGACAAAVAGMRRRLLDTPVTVHVRGGQLTITWRDGEVYMAGPATHVFEGEIDI